MCGIPGLVGQHVDGSVCVRRIIDALSHRGPDDQGIYEASGATPVTIDFESLRVVSDQSVIIHGPSYVEDGLMIKMTDCSGSGQPDETMLHICTSVSRYHHFRVRECHQ